MKVSEILSNVDELCPNAFSNKMKIGWINDLEKYLFQEVIKDIHEHVQNLVESQAAYDMDGYTFAAIKDLYVNSRRHTKKGINNYESQYYSFYEKNGKINLYPVPTTSVTDGLKVYYLTLPTDKTVSGASQEDLALTGIYDNCKDLYQFYVMAQIAYHQKEYDDYNNHSLRYNRELLNLQSYLRGTQPDTQTDCQVKNYW